IDIIPENAEIITENFKVVDEVPADSTYQINSVKSAHDNSEKLGTLGNMSVVSGEKDPDYNELVALATKAALKRMLFPSIIALAVPFVGGIVLGVNFVLGILLGATIVAIPRAIFMGNSGGAFDNAKKYIEGGNIEGHGKGSAAHKAAVTGDTVGDTRKDVVGVALDIFIKMMSTVATTLFVVIATISQNMPWIIK
ncbi:MAG: sodium/proton-translocating pyrophosphatase, partial [Clostridia bacterium]|nr:sodium/proton-translocating pyrophosphatase [Clostridia bacterium]